MAKKRTRKDKVRAASHQPLVRQVEPAATLSSAVSLTTESNLSTKAASQVSSEAARKAASHTAFAEILGFEPTLLWWDFGRTGIVFVIVMAVLIGVSWWLK